MMDLEGFSEFFESKKVSVSKACELHRRESRWWRLKPKFHWVRQSHYFGSGRILFHNFQVSKFDFKAFTGALMRVEGSHGSYLNPCDSFYGPFESLLVATHFVKKAEELNRIDTEKVTLNSKRKIREQNLTKESE